MSYQDHMAEGIRQKFYEEAESIEQMKFFDDQYQLIERGEYKINEGKLGEISYNDLFNQYHSHGGGHGGPKERCFVIGVFHTILEEDGANISAIHVGETPSADKREKENQEKLENIEEFGFEVDTWFGSEDFDGYIRMGDSDYPHDDYFSKVGEVRLEVGSSSPFTLAFHLGQTGSFARWPYGSNFVYIYTISDEKWAEKFGLK